MDTASVISGVLVFAFGFLISEVRQYLRDRRHLAMENHRFFYSQLMNIMKPLAQDDNEYYKFWGIDKEAVGRAGKNVAMAVYLANLVDSYHSLYKHRLSDLLKSDYSVFNKIMANRISQEYWVEVVRPHFYGGTGHEIVEVVDALVEKYQGCQDGGL